MDLCSSIPLPPLARRNSGRALATAASKSFSVPGLTSICAISVIIGSASLHLNDCLYRRWPKSKRRLTASLKLKIFVSSVQQQYDACDHDDAARQHDERPRAPRLAISALRTTLVDQCGFVFLRVGKHAGETAARRSRRHFERDQVGLRIAPADLFHPAMISIEW